MVTPPNNAALHLAVELIPASQNYGWGKVGADSRVFEFVKGECGGSSAPRDLPLAELWMGTHPNGMCHLKRREESPGTRGEADSSNDNDYNYTSSAERAATRKSAASATPSASSSKVPRHADAVISASTQRQPPPNREPKTSLLELLQADPAWWLLGGRDHDAENFSSKSSDLPFLFKILSVNKALSIQLHPDKKTAEQLFRSAPELYKDPNHKPEIAIPLGPFEALMAFRKQEEIFRFLETVPELAEVVLGGRGGGGCSSEDATRCSDLVEGKANATALPKLYANLMRQDAGFVREIVEKLVKRLEAGGRVEQTAPGSTSPIEHLPADQVETTAPCPLAPLILRLQAQYPGDVGIFSVFFLNYVQADRGEFLFCAANVPHAYLSGDCIECMALSDNVIRAGLTPKFKDVDLLLKMCDYRDDLLPKLVSRPRRVRVLVGEGGRGSGGGGGGPGRATSGPLPPGPGPSGGLLDVVPPRVGEVDQAQEIDDAAGIMRAFAYKMEGIDDFQVLEIREMLGGAAAGAGKGVAFALDTASIALVLRDKHSDGREEAANTAGHAESLRINISPLEDSDSSCAPGVSQTITTSPGSVHMMRSNVLLSMPEGLPAGVSVFLATSGTGTVRAVVSG